jgi:glycosyltransferase involved in cell wall biosynthesis
VDQSIAFFIFAKKCVAIVRGKTFDVVFATSGRLMTAALGAWLSRRMKVPLYLDIRDIFVDTIRDVLSPKVAWLVCPIFSLIEKLSFEQAKKINIVSEGFFPYFKSRYPRQLYACFTNGIDEEFVAAGAAVENELWESDLEVINILYAGNLGEGQGLHKIIPGLARRLGSRVRITVIGDGGCRKQLETALAEENCPEVIMLPPVSRARLIESYRRADVLFLHLNNYRAFEKVLPSKLFEYAAMGKPILAGVGGYAAKFINEEIDNAAVFEPCNDESAVDAFKSLKIFNSPRKGFLRKFARVDIMRRMAVDVLGLNSGASMLTPRMDV